MSKTMHILRLAMAAAVGAGLASSLSACRGERTDQPPRQFLPDMDDSPKFKPQTEASFFEDGREMRPRVAGTYSFGMSTDADDPRRQWHIDDTSAVFKGFDDDKPVKDDEPAWRVYIPEEVIARVANDIAATGPRPSTAQAFDAMLARGQERFNIYCSACHGYSGDGQGTVGVRWASPVPSFHDPKYADRAVKTGMDGYVFSVIRNGVPDIDPAKPPKMPSYADKVSIPDAWSIVAYLRVLQASRTGDLNSIPAEERLKLERSKPTAGKQTSIGAAANSSGVAAADKRATGAEEKQ